MKRASLYSRSGGPARGPLPVRSVAGDAEVPSAAPTTSRTAPPDASDTQANKPRADRWYGRFARRFRTPLTALAGAALALIVVAGYEYSRETPRRITQQDIDKAVLHTLVNKQLPSRAAMAYEKIRGSVVRVRGMTPGKNGEPDTETGVGSGVVIVDTGIILTNLHVAAGAGKLKVVFHDGSESDAVVIGTQPEHDLAVLQAKTIPDDLQAATLRSTADLAPGDEVVAVGFPFGIGPSASAGVVSGLKREFRSPEGKRVLTNLIQFDAAANPGSSGGPLVTMDGAVVGIVTAILNPAQERVFIGIGFAVPIENAAAGVGMHPF